jgi:zinc/manganese transport system permease protein
VLVLGRPLLFATVDRDVARATGVPVRALDLAFLVVVAVTVAQSTQVVGALLVLGLLAAPAAAAGRLSPSPWSGLSLAVVLSVAAVWLGLWVCYLVPSLPPSTAIVSVAFVAYVAAVVARR